MAIPLHSKPFYEFGPFRINCIARLLLRGEDVVSLTPKQFDLLLVLVQNSGHVVEKEWLMREIWPNTVVEEGNLTSNIYSLRKALGEDKKGQHYIQTVPRRGYRFVGEVRQLIAGDGWPAVKEPVEFCLVTGQEQENLTVRSGVRWAGLSSIGARGKLVLVGFALLAVTMMVAFYLVWGKPNTPASGGTVKTIAVLPFKPLSGDSRNESLELGMAETLINKLNGVRQLIVRPTSSIRKYTSLEQDPIAAGRQLEVDYVLEGSLQMEGDKTRATVRLLSVKDGRAIWTDTCDEQCSNVFALQDAIAGRIATGLAIEMTWEERQRLAKNYTASTEAFEAYARGRFLAAKRNPRSVDKSIEYLEQAIKLDPNYALAYVALADAYTGLRVDGRLTNEVMLKVREMVVKALQIDDTLAEAHAAMGKIKLGDRDLVGAQESFKRALELNPNSAEVRNDYSGYLKEMKRDDEALAELKRTVELEPTSALRYRNVAISLYYAHHYDEAIEQCQKALELDDDMPTTYRWLAQSYENKGHLDRAVEAYLKTAEFGPEVEAEFKEAYAASGWNGFWRKSVELKKERAKQRKVSAWAFALTYMRLGDKDQAFAWLEKMAEERGSGTYSRTIWNMDDPLFDGIRSDPRYAELMRRINVQR